MPVLGWHILAGNHEIIDFLIVHGADVNQEFDGVDEEGSMFGIFTVRCLLLCIFRKKVPKAKFHSYLTFALALFSF